MKQFNFIILAIVAILGSFCTNQISQNVNSISRMPDGNKDFILLSQISSEVEFIILEENDSTFFDYITKFKAVDSLFFFISNRNLNLFCFRSSGEFVFKTNQIGRGPGEYTTITDYAIDKSRSIISIYDINLRKFFEFDFSGRLLNEISSHWFFNDIEWMDDGFLGFESANFNMVNNVKIAPGLILLDSSYTFVQHVYKLEQPTDHVVKSSLFNLYGEILFSPFWESTIYKIEERKLVEYRKFDFGEAAIENVEKFKNGLYSLSALKEQKKAISIGAYMETNRFSILLESFGYFSCYYIFKENDPILYGKFIVNDIAGPVNLNLVGADNNGLLFYDPQNPLPMHDDWLSHYQQNHGSAPSKALSMEYEKISNLAGKIANNVIIKIK
jgi:hypothetical protein